MPLVLSPSPGVSAPSPPTFQRPRGRAHAGRRSRGLRCRPQGPGVWSLQRVSFLRPQGAEGEDGEAKCWQQDVGRRRGREGAARKRPPCPGNALMGWASRAELAAGEQLRHTGPS